MLTEFAPLKQRSPKPTFKPQTHPQSPPSSDLPDGPLRYVVQGGSHSQLVFVDDIDMRNYHSLLVDSAPRWHVRIHAFLFMPTYLQLLVSEMHDGDLSGMMQFVQSKHSKYLNRRHRDTWLQVQTPKFLAKKPDFRDLTNDMPPLLKVTGHNWAHHFFRAEVAPEEYAHCLRFIESSPFRAGVTDTAAGWKWSSFDAHAAGHDPTGFLDMARFQTIEQSRTWHDFVHAEQAPKPAPETPPSSEVEPVEVEPQNEPCANLEPLPESEHDSVSIRESNCEKVPDRNAEVIQELLHPDSSPAPLRPMQGRIRHWYLAGLQSWQLRLGSFVRHTGKPTDILQDWRYIIPWLKGCIHSFSSATFSPSFCAAAGCPAPGAASESAAHQANGPLPAS